MSKLILSSNPINNEVEGVNDDVWDYIERSVDPGSTLFIATALYCVVCLFSIPIIVNLYKRYGKRWRDKNVKERKADMDSLIPLTESARIPDTALLSGQRDELARPLLQELDCKAPQPPSSMSNSPSFSEVKKPSYKRSVDERFEYHRMQDDEYLLESQEEYDIQICCGKNAVWRKHVLSKLWNDVKEIAQYDRETKQIIKLALPYTTTALIDSALGGVTYILIGNYIGVRALSAYAVVELMLDLSDDFNGGIVDAAMTLIPNCIGKGNNYQAGQYVQISSFLYVMGSIPAAIFWSFFMFDIIIWFGFDERVAGMAESYTRINLVSMLIQGVASTFGEFLDVAGFEVYSAVFTIITSFIETGIYVTVFMCVENMNLVIAAYIDLGLTIFFGALFFIIPLAMGWIDEYVEGMFYNIAIRNTFAVRNLIKIAAPLSLASILSYGEWEVLTIFAAHLGPAEVAAWALLGFLWEIFEAATEAIGESAEVRVGYHLGRGNSDMARISANKTLFIGTCFGFCMTTLLCFMGGSLAVWLTDDIMIQHIIKDSIPYLSIGNVTMTYGMICSYISFAQGRYRLSTTVAFFTSWAIMIPSAALMVYVFDYNIKCLVPSVVFGYTASCTSLAVFVLLSDWEEASRRIMKINEETGHVEDSDSVSENGDSGSRSTRDSTTSRSSISSSSSSSSSCSSRSSSSLQFNDSISEYEDSSSRSTAVSTHYSLSSNNFMESSSKTSGERSSHLNLQVSSFEM